MTTPEGTPSSASGEATATSFQWLRSKLDNITHKTTPAAPPPPTTVPTPTAVPMPTTPSASRLSWAETPAPANAYGEVEKLEDAIKLLKECVAQCERDNDDLRRELQRALSDVEHWKKESYATLPTADIVTASAQYQALLSDYRAAQASLKEARSQIEALRATVTQSENRAHLAEKVTASWRMLGCV